MVIERFFDFWAQNDHVCAGSVMLRGSLLDQAGGQRTDLVLSGDIEYWAYLATFGRWGFLPEVLLHVDGTQIPSGNLYRKFYDRYRRCATIESWQSRIVGRLRPRTRRALRGSAAEWPLGTPSRMSLPAATLRQSIAPPPTGPTSQASSASFGGSG